MKITVNKQEIEFEQNDTFELLRLKILHQLDLNHKLLPRIILEGDQLNSV
jgi:hypothetical protein